LIIFLILFSVGQINFSKIAQSEITTKRFSTFHPTSVHFRYCIDDLHYYLKPQRMEGSK